MKEDFIAQLRSLGLGEGDVVLVHSSMKALGTNRTPQDVLRDIITVIGTQGTLLVPALSYDTVTAEQPRFSVSSTEPCIGLIPRTFFHMENVIRSVHPTHSVCAYGRYAVEMTSQHYLDETPVGSHSPFMKLLDYSGKLLFIGDVVKCCTFMHGIEEIAKAPYTLKKERTRYIIEDENGIVREREMIGHDFSGYQQEYQKIKDLLQYPEIRTGKVGQADCYLIDAATLAKKALEKFKDDAYYFVKKN